MAFQVQHDDVFGFVRHALDAHLLGIVSAASLLQECGCTAVIADADTCAAFTSPEDSTAMARAVAWLRLNRITALGFSYRLDPAQGAEWFGRVIFSLRNRHAFAAEGGTLRAVFFAGLPDACSQVSRENPAVTAVFDGDESAAQTLSQLGVPRPRWPQLLTQGMRYDEDRLALGRELTQNGRHLAVAPCNRSGYHQYGTRQDTLLARLQHARRLHQPPLMRAHVGPYLPDRAEAVRLFADWSARLARTGHLDVLSIGTSQLTQSAFGEDWSGRPNGGGVPINAPEEYARIWEVSRPLLLRTYAGTRNIRALAEMHECTHNIAWHALSLWWFCRIDGRGPNTVLQNLREHQSTLQYVAGTGKPFEPNVAHHFSFRGADDLSAIVSTVLAARFVKRLGIRTLVLQVMLNTPKATWGVQDLAKARATLQLVRELEADDFQVVLQPRAGLDYFSHDLAKARAQLAAATALMDDIEPDDPASPPMIHVVSFSEASHLADPSVVDESVQIVCYALDEYRRRKREGSFALDMAAADAASRTCHLVGEARQLLTAIETAIPNLYTAEGLYATLCRGYLAVPHLWEGRDEFAAAVQWQTKLVRGGVHVVDVHGEPVTVAQRIQSLANTQKGIRVPWQA